MATQADVDKLVDLVVKIRGEVVVLKDAFASLKDQVENGTPVEQLDLTALASAIESVDALNPDTVVEEPAPAPEPEPVVEEPVVEEPVVDEPVFIEPAVDPEA